MLIKTLLILLLASLAQADNCIVWGWKDGQMVCERTINDKWRDAILASSLLFAGTVADVESTKRAIDHGATEWNPIMKPFANSRLKMYAFRLTLNIIAIRIAWKHDEWQGLYFAGMAYGVIAGWNLRF